MGLAFGKVEEIEYGPVLTDSPHETPCKGSNNLKEFVDPRSPTFGIDRTPIQLTATPRPVKDPRSPSEGIERTPIVQNQSFIYKPELIDILESSVDEEKSVSDEMPNCDLDLLVQEIEKIEIDASKPDESIQQLAPMNVTIYEDADEFELFNNQLNTSRNSGEQKFNENKLLNLNKLNLSALNTSTRSPLGPKNILSNRPLSIVQRKQVLKAIEMMGNDTQADKENIFYRD